MKPVQRQRLLELEDPRARGRILVGLLEAMAKTPP
jgi:hypothetical protein